MRIAAPEYLVIRWLARGEELLLLSSVECVCLVILCVEETLIVLSELRSREEMICVIGGVNLRCSEEVV